LHFNGRLLTSVAAICRKSAEVEAELKRINAELNALGKKRSDMLSFLSGTDVFGKYKQVSDEMVTLRADITSLERQRGFPASSSGIANRNPGIDR
jgi:uncharacterized protein YydD (DUF2326 family)